MVVSRAFIAICFLLLSAGGTAAEEVVVTVYSSPPATVSSPQGEPLGETGKAFRLSLPDDPDQTVTLVLTAEGYQQLTVTRSASELEVSRRIPATGVLQLQRDLRGPWVAGLGVVIVLGAGALARRRRKSDRAPGTPAPFTKGELLGRGSTAEVYAASSPRHPETQLAVKILKPECSSDQAIQDRLFRSLETSRALTHQNLVRVFDSGRTEDGLPYILMERLEGMSLEQHLLEHPRPPHDEVLKILGPLCSALAYLHSCSIAHRDVKPENVFLTKDGDVKLLDLEISRSEESEDLTKTGVVVGTPFYLAPEQIRGEAAPSSDQYAVGVILFEMLTGQKPFASGTPSELIQQHLNKPVPSARALHQEVSLLQEAVLNKLLAKQPHNRFDDVEQAWAAIEEALRPPGEGDQTGTFC